MNIETVNELITSLESGGELSIREQKFLKLAKAFKQLAAENVALKNVFGPGDAVLNFLTIALRHTTYDQIDLDDVTMAFKMSLPETPATDRIVAGIKADGRVEGINFAASRLAAAFNHGFVDKPMAEVGDVVRMILTAKEDLANDPALPADGLSGEYAEKSLTEWEAVLREGADKC
ncbi:hypothetical protein HPB55_22160 [Klebsiella michiganensis]|uniref:hypothetical protein n=1 Tax=Klebsiella michiganensis TaxID=1134687 RepID=UPI000E2A0C40|nr:hypothetical protein [Klebsiella michiganensis]MBQ4656792.1 hypothetical protein [Klebsiella michiganensis]MBQ4659263.1 hypothetical protein [Klebsiella michiganensis]RFC04482.1 hypothetical protein DDJ70_23265 [Klebsiella michiganensis]